MGKDKKKDQKKDRKKDKNHKKDKKRKHSSSSSSSSSSESDRKKKQKKQKKLSHSRSKRKEKTQPVQNIQQDKIEKCIETKQAENKDEKIIPSTNIVVEQVNPNIKQDDEQVIPEKLVEQKEAEIINQNVLVEEQNKVGNQIQEENNEEDEREKKINLELLKRFGFTTFGSSKGKDHTVSNCNILQSSTVEGVFKATNEKRKYRQYMHRRGGFNRLLDKME